MAPATVNFSHYRMMEGPRSKCVISDLLGAFCGSLEEQVSGRWGQRGPRPRWLMCSCSLGQIKCRKYFYKSAVLIKGESPT